MDDGCVINSQQNIITNGKTTRGQLNIMSPIKTNIR